MIGINLGGDVGASGVFLTNLDEIGSLATLACTTQTTFTEQSNVKKKITNKKERKSISKPSLRYLYLDDSNWAITWGRLLYESDHKLIGYVGEKYGGRHPCISNRP